MGNGGLKAILSRPFKELEVLDVSIKLIIQRKMESLRQA